MNTFEKHPTRWRRFVQAGLILVLGCLGTSGRIALDVLRAESAKASAIILAGGLLWIAILLWGILFVEMISYLNAKWKKAAPHQARKGNRHRVREGVLFPQSLSKREVCLDFHSQAVRLRQAGFDL